MEVQLEVRQRDGLISGSFSASRRRAIVLFSYVAQHESGIFLPLRWPSQDAVEYRLYLIFVTIAPSRPTVLQD
jgi:hypothetical protein